MTGSPNAYDEMPYRSRPIEWTAPERLALASLVHGGPTPPLDAYNVLELGCGNGANLLAMAHFRRDATFVGIDGARSQIERADAWVPKLGLSNVSFIHGDFCELDENSLGQFEYVIAHGVCSWVPRNTLDALLGFSARSLKVGGLLYLNYNTRPGWDIRGMVRNFLIGQTSKIEGLRDRAHLAQDVSSRLRPTLELSEHPYSQLLAREFEFVCENDVSHIAHEYLATDNHPYWRSEFLELAADHGLEFVADADFNYTSGRLPDGLDSWLEDERIEGTGRSDTVDLLCYRQMHSPIFTHAPVTKCPPTPVKFEELFIASCLFQCDEGEAGNPMFEHPSGCGVEAKDVCIRTALTRLQPLWPRGLRVGAVFPDVSLVVDDLNLLHRNGLIELRCIEPGDCGVGPAPLNRLEGRYGGYATTPYHTVETAPVPTIAPATGGKDRELEPESAN